MNDFLQTVFSGVLTGLVYSVIAVAFVVVYRASQILNFAQGMVLAIGGYLVAWLALSSPLPLWLAIIVAFAISALMGLAIERFLFRRLIGEPLFSLVMVTLGLYVVLAGVSMMIWGPEYRPFPELFPKEILQIGPFQFPQSLFWGGFIAVVVIIALVLFFERTKWGLRMSAVAEGQQVAQAMGISVEQSIAVAWALSGVISTLAAIILLSGRTMSVGVGDVGMRALPIALLGGLESVRGVIPAGLIVGIAGAVSAFYLDSITSGGIAEIVPFVIMVIIVAIRPSGLFGWKTIERV